MSNEGTDHSDRSRSRSSGSRSRSRSAARAAVAQERDPHAQQPKPKPDPRRTDSRTRSSRSRSSSRGRGRDSRSRSRSPYSDSRDSDRRPYRDDYSEGGSDYRARNRSDSDDGGDRKYTDEAYTEEEDTSHFSDESSNDHYSYDEEEEEEARERDIDRVLFSEMPQPKMTDDKRTLEDDYAFGLQENIKQLQGHILDIQKREVEKMSAYGNSLAPTAEPKKEESERKRFEQSLGDIREERKKYRAMLYDAIKERDDLLESRQISKIEERIAKNRARRPPRHLHLHLRLHHRLHQLGADRVNKYNGVDVTLLLMFFLQMGLTVLYIIFMDFTNDPAGKASQIYGWTDNVEYLYVFLIDIFMMVFVGFTMQRAFLRKWGVLWHGWFAWETSGNPDGKIQLDTASLIHGLYCATTVLVAYGAVLGRTNTLQTLVFTFLGGFFYCLNYYITVGEIHGTDLGGALTIHLFGAFFGIGVSFIIGLNDLNDFTIPGEFRVVINTALACCASGVTVVGLDWLFGPQKFRAHVLQHGVMAGGVVMGCAHSELVPAYVAIILGSLIAAPCTWVGLRYATPFMNKAHKLLPDVSIIPKDTAGVLFAHGVPGFIGGLAGICATADYQDATQYGQTASDLFPNDPSSQAGRLTATWAVSMAIGLGAGALTGLLLFVLRVLLPNEHVATKRRPAPAVGPRPFHDEVNWRELPLDVDE
ncbi:ammonium transporter subfamily protein [Acanthamoeba castellanii str. Neff]|uniref:Ammonium transporter subfamily protein n=1 Tax=Acanthamoeba castellanii (strain ATCC 30010 / Neff) TaxID=1257118 RepID=L8GMB4_ACACF|nr:ammonium transporter subfamily protein [Acanthamoeba castellanii str. Neff]ELR14200.1 ammonium transporter subfamily protein [Acanthamoeba castellanii str. Neff]